MINNKAKGLKAEGRELDQLQLQQLEQLEQEERELGEEELQRKRKLDENTHSLQTLPVVAENIPALSVLVQYFRRLTSSASREEAENIIRHMVASGLVPRLVLCLSLNNELLQFESLWALTNITSGPSQYSLSVIEANAIPLLVAMVSHPSSQIREQSMWALGNLSGDDGDDGDNNVRTLILDEGVSTAIVQNSHPETDMVYQSRTAIWVVANLLRGKAPPSILVLNELIPFLIKYMAIPQQMQDNDVFTSLMNAIEAMTSYETNAEDVAERLMAFNFLEKLKRIPPPRKPGHESDLEKSLKNLTALEAKAATFYVLK